MYTRMVNLGKLERTIYVIILSLNYVNGGIKALF